jgi:hypothetical protein
MRQVSIMFGSALASAALFVAPAANAAPPAPDAVAAAPAEVEPPDYPPPSTRWKVAGVGLGALAVFYGLGVAPSYAFPDVPGMKDLRIPVAGPWIATAHSSCGTDLDCSNVLVIVRTILFVLDGAAQAGSVGVVLEGLFMPTQEAPALPPSEAPRAPPPSKPAPGGNEKNLYFVPGPTTVGADGIGIGVVGRF